MLALVTFGLLLRTGVLAGEKPAGGTIVPAAIAGLLLVALGLLALIPDDVERRLAAVGRRTWQLRPTPKLWVAMQRVAAVPATVSTGVRTAIDFMRHPDRAALALGGAVGFWAANIAILWASFEAFGGGVQFGVLVQGFFVGMAANLVPSPAAGAGPVDAGMIAAFALFDVPNGVVFPGVLIYRVIAFWLPVAPGIVAYFQLRRTVAHWRREDAEYPGERALEAT
jgi:uncharacterized membrane protein YbhN (UPF0104 family)